MIKVIIAGIAMCVTLGCSTNMADTTPAETAPVDSTPVESDAAGQSAVNYWRAEFRANKADVVSAAMQLSDNEVDGFWSVYERYENDLKKIGDKKISLIEQYAAVYDGLNDANAAQLMKNYFAVQEELLKLRMKYAKQMSESLSPAAAARFVQMENRIQLLVDIQLASRLPIIKKPMEEVVQ